MSTYRIAPNGVEGWKVQSKWFGLFWVTLAQPVAPGYSEYLSFDTEKAAEEWIDKALDYDRRNAEWHRQARDRRRGIAPRSYPPA